MGANTQIAILVGLYLGYRHVLPYIGTVFSCRSVSGREQIELAERFLAPLTGGQLMQVKCWLDTGYDVSSVVGSLGCHRFEVLRITIAPTLRANPSLIDKAMVNCL